MEKMTEHEKLEYIHSTLQDVANCIEWGKLKSKPTLGLDEDMINKSLTMVEDIATIAMLEAFVKEKHFDKDGELIK